MPIHENVRSEIIIKTCIIVYSVFLSAPGIFDCVQVEFVSVVRVAGLPDLLTLLKHGNNLCRPENETGSGVRVHVNDIQVALFRFGVRVFAINATCPHAGKRVIFFSECFCTYTVSYNGTRF